MRFNVFILFVWGVLLIVVGIVNSQAVASFYTMKGPTIVVQDPSTGNFLYNIYAAKGFSSMQAINATNSPKVGTSMALAGYSTGVSVYVSFDLGFASLH